MRHAEIAPAEILVLIFIFSRIVPLVARLQQHWHRFRFLIPAFRSIESLQRRSAESAESIARPGRAIALNEAVELERVSYRYPGNDDREALESVSLRIPAGAITALNGPSGAGKSTVAGLVAGLLAPAGGRVLVDGEVLDAERMLAWRRQVAYVPQSGHAFHESVRENVRWLRPDADDAEVWQALERVAAADFVRELPRQLDTVVGDRAVRLSGGQRQRLALARALLASPSLLILDEATSELDPALEARIQAEIRGLGGSMTVLVIAHRDTSLAIADHRYEIRDGQAFPC